MKPETNSKGHTKVFQMFRPLFIILLIGGFNLIYNYNIYTRVTSRIYSTILLIVISYANMACCPYQEMSFIWSLLEYVVHAVTMMFYESRLPLFLQRISELDKYLRVNIRHHLRTRLKIYLILGVMCSIRTTYITIYCFSYSCFTSVYLFFIYEFSMLSLDVSRVWRYHIFEEVGHRLTLLRKRMEENPEENYYLYVNKNKAMKENKIKLGLTLYKKIADLLDLMSPELNASLFMGVTCSLPKLVINVYRILLVIGQRLTYDTMGIMIFNIFQTTVFIVSPCVVVEMYRVEVERIRLYLMHKLIYETDSEVKEDIQLFIQYTRIRNFRYKVCRVFAMDLQLPLQLLNHCTTYVIVVVNFTKVFE